MDGIGREMIGKIGKLTIFMIAVVAASLFALPTVISADTGKYTFLAMVMILIAIIGVLMSIFLLKKI